MRPSSPGKAPASTSNSFGGTGAEILGAAVVTVAMQYISFCDIYSNEKTLTYYLYPAVLRIRWRKSLLNFYAHSAGSRVPTVLEKKQTKLIDILFFFSCRPCDRNLRDAELISCRLRRVEPLCRLPSSALQQLAMCGFYEDLEKGVTRKYSHAPQPFSVSDWPLRMRFARTVCIIFEC